MLQVDLVAYAGPRWDHADTVKCLLGPSKERVPLTVSPVLPLDVGLVRMLAAEQVDLNRVVDDEVHVHERVDPFRIAAGTGHGRSHGGQIHNGRDAGEVLHQDPGWHERDVRLGGRHRPVGQGPDVRVGHIARPGPAEEVLEQDLHRVWQAGDLADPVLGEPAEPVDRYVAACRRQATPGGGELRGHVNPTPSRTTPPLSPMWRGATRRSRGGVAPPYIRR